MGKAGVRSLRGRGEFYEEVKSEQVNLLLTPTAFKLLNQKIRGYRDSSGRELSRCEYFERWARDAL